MSTKTIQDAARPEGMALWLLRPWRGNAEERRGHSFRT